MNPMRAFRPAPITAGVSLLVMLAIPVEPAKRADGPAGTSNTRNAPAPPRSVVDTTFPAAARRTVHVPAGGDLQKALDAAHAGDLITLEPKAVYQGPFRLPATKGVGWIVVSTALPQPGLPGQGQRVNPLHAAVMPKLIASSGPVIQARRDAHHFRFVGLEIAPADGVFLYALVELGNEDTEIDALPHDIVFDRCYLHGDPVRGTRRGIAMNSRDTAVIDSYLSDFKEQGADSQAIAGWNGPGPFKIVNNYLEAAGENIMFGGADPAIRDLVPADIEIRHNHLAKPLRWKVGHDTFEGAEWSVKNLFELKNARRVVIDGNLFEYNWPHAQNGFAILFTVRNQDGRAPWSTVEDVAFRNNVVRHVGAGINVLGRDDNHPSQQVKRLEIRNNLFLDVGGPWGGGRLFQLLDGTSDVVIDHNTALQTGGLLFGGDGAGHTGFVFQNNIAPDHRRGISGSGSAVGLPALNRYFPASLVRRNVIVGGIAGEYPPDNFFAASLENVGFESHAQNRMRLIRASPYVRAGTDGRDPGADLEAPESASASYVGSSFSWIDAVRRPWNPLSGGSIRLKPDPTYAGGTAAVLFWLSFVLLAYVYAGYPLVAALTAALHSRPHRRAPIEPSVSVVVIAHNECTRLKARIENLLALDYPKDRLEIVIGSDGSTDETVKCAQAYVNRGVTVRPFDERRGKPSLLNVLVSAARGDIVVLADVRQRFDPAAVRALVANFADPTVGAVSGELMLPAERSTGTAGQGSASYWRYEKLIRAVESRVDSTIGATGAVYAIRRDLFETIPQDTILDDVLIPLRIARRGYRVVFEPAARAHDQVSTSTRQEFARRTRTIAGTFQLFVRERWLFNPLANRLWLQTMSHKALRLMLPPLHVALLMANVALATLDPYRWILAAQLAFYAAALLGCARRRAGRRPIFVSVPHTICLLSWATIIGFLRMVTHRQPVTWEHVSPPGIVGS
jgi:cellulose synthase/poly-beta-1,6-N-acetylglucosamine synthase-like glycosyltransferase